MDKVLLVNKPAGITSFDAVRRCRKIFHEKKIGHTGTLDPEASGLLIVLMGKYTKFNPFCMKDGKAYTAHFRLGMKTDTQDIWGKETAVKEPAAHTQSELDEAAGRMTGDLLQTPPMYSALKVNGKKLYEYARQGIEIEREARPITVSSLSVVQTGDNDFEMKAVVSGGTYIRTLIEDYAALLGEYACMTSLVRTAIGTARLSDAYALDDLHEDIPSFDPLCVIDSLWEPVEYAQEEAVLNGRKLRLEGVSDHVLLKHEGRILAVYEKRQDGLYHSVRGLF